MFILHIALGGCLGVPPVRFGMTADTGGHIAYVLGAASAQAALAHVDRISIVTRLFEDHRLGSAYARPSERIDSKTTIDRIPTRNRAYLEKEALTRALPDFAEAFCNHLSGLTQRPTIIHAHFADAAFVAKAAKARYGIPFVYTPHALGIDKRKLLGANDSLDARIAAEREAIALADAIIVSSRSEAEQQVAAYAVPAFAGRTHQVPPGVPQPIKRPGRSTVPPALGIGLRDRSKPIVLAIARPARKKNLAALVRAFAATPGLKEWANLVILAGQHNAGRQTEEETAVIAELKALCDAPSLHGCVALPPAHDSADVAALYQYAAEGGVFVNPAFHEPFGLTIIEAAAAGLPVVVTQHGGPADIIAATGHGLLVDPHDDAAIGAACLRIVTDRALHKRFAAAARQNVGKFSWSHYAERSVSLYTSLCHRPRLLASDIDNTLTGCPSGAQSFTQWFKTRPVPFVAATGRSFAKARAVLNSWHLPTPDAFIVDVGTRLMKRRNGGGWFECLKYAALIDQDWDRPAVAAVLSKLALRPQPPGTAGPHKISFFGSASDARAIQTALAEAALGSRVVFSHGRLIDVLAPHAGKAAAVAFYAAGLGLTLRDCVASGDSGNDRDMLEACGHAIVVGNASEELDGIVARPGLRRVTGHHATGVMQGLADLGLAPHPQEWAPA